MPAISPILLAVLTVGLLALLLGIFIGMHTIPSTSTSKVDNANADKLKYVQNDYDPLNDNDPVYQAFIQGPNRDSIKNNIKLISMTPHQAGTDRQLELANIFKDSFLKAGFDRAYLVPYKALLSYTNPERPNKIYLTEQSNVILVSGHQEPALQNSNPEGNVPAYNGYSPSEDIIGEPVYCNYGQIEDFQLLEEEGRIDFNEKICIIRYGKIYRGNKVANAQLFGCSGVILFSDPGDMAPFGTGPESVYPNSSWMNGKAMQSGSIWLGNGDPLTPGYPSKVDGFRENLNNNHLVQLPKIPSQPIGYDDAKFILSRMSGIIAANHAKFHTWTGKLNITYRLGPGFQSPGFQLRMVINNELVEKIVYNVIAVLDGNVEPDRYVLIGNHRDSWSYGALDAASGGSSLLESAKTIGQYHKSTGWRPKRSLVFASWAAEELGMIGSTEWVEEFGQILNSNAVAYINVDTCVYGPVLNSDASPSLAQTFIDSIKRVPGHTSDQELFPNETLFTSWIRHNNDDINTRVDIISSGSDQVPFVFGQGIPSININFKNDMKKYPVSGYPAYHTGYETFYLVSKFIDPDFSIHESCSRLINILLYSLSCSTIIPVNFRDLSRQITDDYKRQLLDDKIRLILNDNNKKLDINLEQDNNLLNNTDDTADNDDEMKLLNFLQNSMKLFHNGTAVWERSMKTIKESSLIDQPLKVRQINDLITMIERTFSQKFVYKSLTVKNLLYGTTKNDQYQTILFPGIYDILNDIEHLEMVKKRTNGLTMIDYNRIENEIKENRQELRRHLNDISLAFQRAAKLLTSIDNQFRLI